MLKRFKKNTDGNVAMMFSVAAFTILIGIGAAVDYGAASSTQQDLQDMVDAATLAAARSNSTNKEELLEIAEEVVRAHNQAGFNVTLDVKVIDDQVHVVGRTLYDTHLMGFAGKPTMDVSAEAASPISALTPMKIALVLDTTGSMSGTGITALKAASTGFIDELDRWNAPVGVSVVPFGQYVNVGKSRKGSNWLDVSDDGRSTTNEVCWEERRQLTPQVCTETGRTLTRPNIQDGVNLGDISYPETTCTGGDWEYTGETICEMRTTTTTWHGCVGSRQAPYNERATFTRNRIEGVLDRTCGAELQELTTSFSAVKSTINNFTASGSTYLPSGVMWGWRTLQDAEPFKTKVNFQKANRRNVEAPKIMVFMTDGANTLTQGGSEPHLHDGAAGPDADKKTRAICEAAKKDGVQIYTIGFRMSAATSDAKKVLLDCATSGAHYRDAGDSEELKRVFKNLAGQLDTARLAL